MHAPDDPAAIIEDIYRRLDAGVRDRESPLHTPSLGTIGLDGTPRQRIVVLRAFDAQEPCLRIHTDSRSAKVAELAADPRASLLFYDHGAAVQIRIEGRATVHGTDAIADAAWEASRRLSRICYGQQPGPGAALQAPGAFDLPETDEAIAAGRVNFRAVLVRPLALEWLHLRHGAHRRLRLAFEPGARLPSTARWLAP